MLKLNLPIPSRNNCEERLNLEISAMNPETCSEEETPGTCQLVKACNISISIFCIRKLARHIYMKYHPRKHLPLMAMLLKIALGPISMQLQLHRHIIISHFTLYHMKQNYTKKPKIRVKYIYKIKARYNI